MYIITGGAGFIGSAMVWRLNQAGITDILVVDHLASTEKWRNLVNLRYADYMDRGEFLRLVRERSSELVTVKGIVHMGACSSTTERDAGFLMENNFHYTRELCLAAQWSGARFVYASSAATYGNGEAGFNDSHSGIEGLRPLNMYGYSKQLFDLWALRSGALDSVAGLKFFNVYGPNEYHKGDMRSVVCKAFADILKSGEMTLFASDRQEYLDGGQMRDFVYVKDCCDVLFWLLERPEVNGLYNLGSGQARTWNDLATALFAAMSVPRVVRYVPMPEYLRGKYQYFTEAPMAKLREAGYPMRFHSLEEGVSDYVRGYLASDDPCLG